MTTGADVVAAARAELGTPWVFQGRIPGVALDCFGLLVVAATAAGLCIDAWDSSHYGRPDVWSLLDVADRQMIRLSQFELGAAVVVTPLRGDMPHVGIVGDYRHGGWSLIHATNMSRPACVIETRLMDRLALTVRAIYRLPGVS